MEKEKCTLITLDLVNTIMKTNKQVKLKKKNMFKEDF